MAAVLAAVGGPWVGVRVGREVRRRARLVAVDAALAAAAFLLTLAGFLVVRPGALGRARPSWGFLVALAISAAWAVAAGRAFLTSRAADHRHP